MIGAGDGPCRRADILASTELTLRRAGSDQRWSRGREDRKCFQADYSARSKHLVKKGGSYETVHAPVRISVGSGRRRHARGSGVGRMHRPGLHARSSTTAPTPARRSSSSWATATPRRRAGGYNTQVADHGDQRHVRQRLLPEKHNAFNVYRLNLNLRRLPAWPGDYDLNGTPNDASDDTDHQHQPSEHGAELHLLRRLVALLAGAHHSGGVTTKHAEERGAGGELRFPTPTYVIVLLNEPGFGGCNRGPGTSCRRGRVAWQVLAHEAGHGIGGSVDEYTRAGHYTGGRRSTPATAPPSPTAAPSSGTASSTPPPRCPPPWEPAWTCNRTVGVFEGCLYNETGIYRR